MNLNTVMLVDDKLQVNAPESYTVFLMNEKSRRPILGGLLNFPEIFKSVSKWTVIDDSWIHLHQMWIYVHWSIALWIYVSELDFYYCPIMLQMDLLKIFMASSSTESVESAHQSSWIRSEGEFQIH